MMQVLNHNDLVRLAGWSFEYATVGTLNGYCPESAEQFRARGEVEAWANYAGAALSDSKHYYEREKARLAKSITISDSEVVLIEGVEFRVKVAKGCTTRPVFCDPITFVRV